MARRGTCGHFAAFTARLVRSAFDPQRVRDRDKREPTDRVIVRGQPKRHFGSDQSLWRNCDWNGFAILLRGAKGKCRGRRVRKPVSNR